uniref:Uncharacterized protein n=1 Tax=Oryza nivara TaxID=4536 RepID=A0A0E0IQ03_ORYNI
MVAGAWIRPPQSLHEEEVVKMEVTPLADNAHLDAASSELSRGGGEENTALVLGSGLPRARAMRRL